MTPLALLLGETAIVLAILGEPLGAVVALVGSWLAQLAPALQRGAP